MLSRIFPDKKFLIFNRSGVKEKRFALIGKKQTDGHYDEYETYQKESHSSKSRKVSSIVMMRSSISKISVIISKNLVCIFYILIVICKKRCIAIFLFSVELISTFF